MRGTTAGLVAAIGTLLAGCAAVPPPADEAKTLAAPSRYKVVLVAGDPSIRAFDNATARLGAMLQSRAGVAPDDIQRLSARDDVVAEGAALATAPAWPLLPPGSSRDLSTAARARDDAPS